MLCLNRQVTTLLIVEKQLSKQIAHPCQCVQLAFSHEHTPTHTNTSGKGSIHPPQHCQHLLRTRQQVLHVHLGEEGLQNIHCRQAQQQLHRQIGAATCEEHDVIISLLCHSGLAWKDQSTNLHYKEQTSPTLYGI